MRNTGPCIKSVRQVLYLHSPCCIICTILSGMYAERWDAHAAGEHTHTAALGGFVSTWTRHSLSGSQAWHKPAADRSVWPECWHLGFCSWLFSWLMPDHVCDFADVKDSKFLQGIVRSSKLPAIQRLPGVYGLHHCCCAIWQILHQLLNVTKTSQLLQSKGHNFFFS